MPVHNFECNKGHQFETEVKWDVDKVRCPECNRSAERVWVSPRSPHRQLPTPIVFFKYADGTIGPAGGINSKTPPKAERVEVRTLGEVRAITKQINERLRLNDGHVEEKYREQREALEHERRSNLSWAMGQESDPHARALYREALERSKGGFEGPSFREFFSEVAEMDSSNRER